MNILGLNLLIHSQIPRLQENTIIFCLHDKMV